MQRIPVESSDLVAIGYDTKTRVLEIEFKEDRIYQYFDVEPEVYDRFIRADSFGEYFFSTINKHYRYKKLEGDDQKPGSSNSLLLVSGNIDKYHDLLAVCQPLGIDLEVSDLPVEEIQSHDLERIVSHKAKQAYKLANRPVVVQDTLWNILALRGFPGAYMRYVSEWLRAEDFLALMQNKSDRTVIRTDGVVYYDGKKLKIFKKDILGKITDRPQGEGVAVMARLGQMLS